MAVTAGMVGSKVEVFDHFLANYKTGTAGTNFWQWQTDAGMAGNFGFASVNEGSFASTVDEANGILAVTTDTGDDDNAVLFAGTFRPDVSGTIVTEWRFKNDSITEGAIYVGFMETLVLATPVMPAEFATATMTYNGTGQMLGANFDPDGTDDDFRALSGDAAAVSGTLSTGWAGATTMANGVRAQDALVADEWHIVRVELSSSGQGEVWVGHKGRGLDRILRATGLLVVNQLFAVCLVENRGGNANVFEIDYGYACGGADFEVS